ncbi:hypothetical protein DYB31_007179, partial [Aphanomyces astaci]
MPTVSVFVAPSVSSENESPVDHLAELHDPDSPTGRKLSHQPKSEHHHDIFDSHAAMTLFQAMEAGAGCIYIVVTVLWGVWYISVLSPSLSNDMWWPDFNATGTQTFLGDIANVQLGPLAVSASASLDLFGNAATWIKDYSGPSTQLALSPIYPRQLLLESTTNLEDVILGIHATSFRFNMRTLIQYCWVDFDQRFELAHTALRQDRCALNNANNAATYLETLLRNIKWADLEIEYGAGGGVFDKAIATGVRSFPSGAAWLASVKDAFQDVASEAALWRSKNATRWQLQWHNAWQAGVDETVVIKNALGMRQNLAIKKVAYVHRGPAWKTMTMYSGLWNDFAYAASGNYSLVRGSPQRENLDEMTFMRKTSMGFTTMSAVWWVVIGPYGSIDMMYVSVPPSLGAALLAYRTTFMTLMKAGDVLVADVRAVVPVDVNPVPQLWKDPDLMYYGGNPVCGGGGAPRSYVMELFGFDDICLSRIPLTVKLTPASVVFALLGLQSSSGDGPTSTTAVCDLCGATAGACVAALADAAPVFQRWGTLDPTTKRLFQNVAKDVGQIYLFQLAQQLSTRQATYLIQAIVNGTDNWSFFGWIQLYDWAMLNREVVWFDGDVSSITLMSKEYASLTFAPSALEIPERAGRYFYILTLYTSSMLAFVASGMLIYGLATHFRVLGRNLFRFNRVAGSVWVGRIFLLVRGMTAVVLLSTSNIEFSNRNTLTSFQWHASPILERLLMTGEATWVVYVVQDLLVVLTNNYSYYAAPLSSCVAWLLIFILEATSPVKATATLERTCSTLVMAKQVACTSGVIQFGSSDRVFTILAIQMGSIVVVYVLAVLRRWRRDLPAVTLLVSGPAETYLDIHVDSGQGRIASFDKATCVMCGLLSIEIGDVQYLFDIKSWMLISQKRPSHSRGMLSHAASFRPPSMDYRYLPSAGDHTSRPFGLVNRMIAVGGLMYMMSSIGGAVLYIISTKYNMANDFWWPYFNTTGTHAYLGNWYAVQLAINPKGFSTSLANVTYGDTIKYNSSSTVISVSPLYGRIVQFEEINTVSHAIVGLRLSDGCQMPWIMTQYCWLDFAKQFPMANTRARQRRCELYKANGAVYLESALRNLDWPSFLKCWGDRFELSIASDLKTTPEGTRWLESVQQVTTTEDEEAAYWGTVPVLHYTMQYQNFKRLGVVEAFNIENAFGVSYPMTIKSTKGLMQIDIQTSMKLYWSFAYDLTDASNNSLLASSSTYAYANNSIESALTDAGIVSQPFYSTFESVRQIIGPFGSIDAYHVPFPSSLKLFYKLAAESVAQVVALNSAAQVAYFNLPLPSSWLYCPSAWRGTNRFTGNLLCNPGTATTSNQMLTLWADGGCSSVTESTYPTLSTNVISALSGTVTDAASTCANEQHTGGDVCTGLVQATVNFTTSFFTRDQLASFATAASSAQHDITTLNVTMVQFAVLNGAMVAQPLFPEDPSFYFFSWGIALEWLLGRREVVSFQGDVGTMVLMSGINFAIDALPNPLEIPANIALYFRGSVLYITAMLAFVAALATGYIVSSAGHIEGLNMLEMNRVGGIVWTGRPLLFLRSMVAICLLSTATLDLKQYGPLGGITSFELSHLELYKLVLAAGEVSWFVYVVCDILILVTRAYTTTYAVMCGLLAWVVAAVFSVGFPVIHSATVDRHCDVVQMDFQVTCDAGTLYVGSIGRFVQLVGISLGCIVLCYTIERFRQPNLVDSRANVSLLLSTGGKYFFALNNWKYKDCYYLDKASAAIAGVLCISFHGKFYVLDIKLWRVFVLEIPDDLSVPPGDIMHVRSKYAFPLIGSSGVPNARETENMPPPRVSPESNTWIPTLKPAQPSRSWSQTLELLAGAVYVAISVFCSAWYCTHSAPYLTNDMWWPRFNTTGTQTFLADVLNAKLATTASVPSLDLCAANSAVYGRYDLDMTSVAQSPVYPRHYMLGAHSDFEDAISGMHMTTVAFNLRMFTQYCWLDFDKKYPIAHTAARQDRCVRSEGDNAAVHMEALLRNVVWKDFVSATGG